MAFVVEHDAEEKSVVSTDANPLVTTSIEKDGVLALSPVLDDDVPPNVAEVEEVGSPGEDAVSEMRPKPGLATGVASTSVLTRSMRRCLVAFPASAVVSMETESVHTDYSIPEKTAAAAFTEAWAKPLKISSRSKPASVSTAEVEVLPLAVPEGVPEKRRSSQRLSRHVAEAALSPCVFGRSEAVVSVDAGAIALTALATVRSDLVTVAAAAGADVSRNASEEVYVPLSAIPEVAGDSTSESLPGVRFLPDIIDVWALVGFLLQKFSLTDLDAVEDMLKICRKRFKDTYKRQ